MPQERIFLCFTNNNFLEVIYLGNGELLELRLLETGFLSRFQNKMSRFWHLAKEKKIL
jgi:hypothetical protein